MNNHVDRHASSIDIDANTPYDYRAVNLSSDREARIIHRNGNIIVLILDCFMLPVTCFTHKRKTKPVRNLELETINYLHRKGYE